jgi:hypothetical protein
MTLRHSVLIASLLGASACGGDAAATAPSRTPGGLRRIQGRVTAFASGAPVPHASLAFGSDVWALDLDTTTDGVVSDAVSFQPVTVTHPAYRDRARVVGRGIHFVNRLDLDLERP